MRYILFSLACALVLTSCGNDKKKTKEERYIQDSSGAINNVSVVVENDIWDGRVGEAIRSVLAKPFMAYRKTNPCLPLAKFLLPCFRAL